MLYRRGSGSVQREKEQKERRRWGERGEERGRERGELGERGRRRGNRIQVSECGELVTSNLLSAWTPLLATLRFLKSSHREE